MMLETRYSIIMTTTKTYTIDIERTDNDPRADLAFFAAVAHATFNDITVTDDSHAAYVTLTFTASDDDATRYANTFDCELDPDD